MRDAPSPQAGILTGPDKLQLDITAYQVLIGRTEVPVTPREFDVLRLLLQHRGEVISAEDLALAIWGHGTFGSRNFVEAHVSRLRRKLREAGSGGVIRTVRGIGYVIRMP